MRPEDPLVFPHDYPPLGGWKRFFIGVRWLGPDTSFFKELRSAQAARSLALMDAWGGGERQALAMRIGVVFASHCRWPTPFFLPDDNAAVIAGGPRFESIEGGEVESAILAIEAIAGVTMDRAFWVTASKSTLGQIVDQLQAVQTASRTTSA